MERKMPTPDSHIDVAFSLSRSEMPFNQEDRCFSSGFPESPQVLLCEAQLHPAQSTWIHRSDNRKNISIGAVPPPIRIADGGCGSRGGSSLSLSPRNVSASTLIPFPSMRQQQAHMTLSYLQLHYTHTLSFPGLNKEN